MCAFSWYIKDVISMLLHTVRRWSVCKRMCSCTDSDCVCVSAPELPKGLTRDLVCFVYRKFCGVILSHRNRMVTIRTPYCDIKKLYVLPIVSPSYT
jgi:hypothetical protein